MSRPRVGSLFAGVEGFGQGLEAAGFEVAWQVEIDKDAVSVLERHYPTTHRVRDVREAGAHNLTPVDVITFGSPCQGFSVAGRQDGLADARSGLFGEAVRIINELHPAVAVWENVPGAFSSNDGRDFGAVLASLAQSGAMDIGWRVLDAQWFGVPQRRRRIFLVADFRAHRSIEVLFESEGCGWDSAACGEAGQGLAGDVEDGSGVISIQYGARPREYSQGLGVSIGGPSYTLDTLGEHADGVLSERRVAGDSIAHAVTCHSAKGGDPSTDNYVACQLADTLSVGANQTTGFVGDDVAHVVQASYGNSSPRGDGADNQVVGTVRSHPRPGSNDFGLAVATWDDRQITAPDYRSGDRFGSPSHTLHTGGMSVLHGIDWQKDGCTVEDGTPTLTTSRTPAVSGRPGMAVRRLTPRECERLMGWPDDWTRYRADGSEIADGPRYRMIGNGVVAPVARWIGERLMRALEAAS